MITGITYHHLKAKIFLLFVCFRCFLIPVYGSDLAELPDTFHITKAEVKYFDNISFFRGSILDSIESPQAYIYEGEYGVAIAIKEKNKYATFYLGTEGTSFDFDRQNINNRGNDELIVYWEDSGGHTSGGGSHFWGLSGVIVYDIDSYNCLLDFQTSEYAEGGDVDLNSEDFNVIDYSSECYTYNVEFTEMQMTIQLIEQTSGDSQECIDVLGDKFVYKLTGSGFVLDRKEKAELGNKENPLYGKIYKRITDIPELKNWTKLGGGVIYPKNSENQDLQFGISNYKDDNGDMVFILQEFVEQDEKGKNPKYKILDTLNIGKLKNNELAWYQQCRKNTIFDSEIIAIVVAEECKNYEDNIVKAWRANTKTGKIQTIENLIGIDCARDHDCED